MKLLCRDKRCLYGWFSGFFAAGACIHLVRAIFGFSLVVGGYAVSRSLSGGISVVLGIVSISFCLLAHKQS